MSNLLMRVLFAVIAAVLFYLLLPPVLRVIGLPINGDVLTIVKVVVAGLLLIYIVRGFPASA